MSDAGAAVGLDRLPWLPDEPRRERAPAGRSELLPWAFAAVVLVAGVSYWMGANSVREPEPTAQPRWSGTVVQLPEPVPVQPEVKLAPAPEVRPLPAPRVEMPRAETREPVRRATPVKTKPVRTQVVSERRPRSEPSAARRAALRPAAPARAQQLWPSRVVPGASGRLVQVGAFGSRRQAKLGWRAMTRAYPAVGGLPAVVVPARNSRGKSFYRFQIGTTSQAHSEVLCQRMRRIDLSCAVVGLPWKAKIER